jgi:hypothetical protein
MAVVRLAGADTRPRIEIRGQWGARGVLAMEEKRGGGEKRAGGVGDVFYQHDGR